jgi:uncharacterized protein YggU (UPF0235/DUF167 family)
MYLKVLVTPGARKETVEEKGDPSRQGGAEAGTLIITVREPAEANRANTRVRELIALRLGVPLQKVRILTGHHSRVKMISISS